MDALKAEAKAGSAGYYPDGRCYSHVADFIDATGYGGIKKGGFNDAIPSSYWAEAHDFADYLNTGTNAADLNLKNIGPDVGNNPYNAPPGSIVVVAAGAPGTSNPTAGDIAVKGDGDAFYNGGDMSYGPASAFPTDKTLGIYVPTQCTSANGNAISFFADHLHGQRNSAAEKDVDAIAEENEITHLFEHLGDSRNEAVREEHQSLIEEVAAAGVAIESIR